MIPKISELIKNNRCYFDFLTRTYALFTIDYYPDEEITEFSRVYTFGFRVPLEEIWSDDKFMKVGPAINFIKWIREDNLTLISMSTKT